MKVKIGPYINWVGPYQLADSLKLFGVSEDRCHVIGGFLAETWVGKLCEWIHSKRNRRVKVKIDNYDTWSMDATLALIILPMLKQLKATKHGSPHIDDEDVPEWLRSSAAPPVEELWDTDGNWHKRWDWVLDEMIWTFEQLQPDSDWELKYWKKPPEIKWKEPNEAGFSQMIRGDDGDFDREGHKAHSDRIVNGLRLFGVYFQNLWD